ncbi:MAG: DUF1566 domain-containing protein [Dokdonella sp.]
MTRLTAAILAASWLTTVSLHAANLPDTGQDTCYNGNVADAVDASNAGSAAADAGSSPRQDCRFGRDAAAATAKLPKTGAGAKGFDYTKIANNGNVVAAGTALGDAAGDWGCTRDNITGLTWEVKSGQFSTLRYSGHTYTWYDTTAATNGGAAGSAGINSCNSTLPGNACNTQTFTNAVNAIALCTYTDWRLPTLREMLTLVFADGSVPAIDASYFPNQTASPFWTGTPYASDPTNAWFVSFADGFDNSGDKSLVNAVRLVRGGSF